MSAAKLRKKIDVVLLYLTLFKKLSILCITNIKGMYVTGGTHKNVYTP